MVSKATKLTETGGNTEQNRTDNLFALAAAGQNKAGATLVTTASQALSPVKVKIADKVKTVAKFLKPSFLNDPTSFEAKLVEAAKDHNLNEDEIQQVRTYIVAQPTSTSEPVDEVNAFSMLMGTLATQAACELWNKAGENREEYTPDRLTVLYKNFPEAFWSLVGLRKFSEIHEIAKRFSTRDTVESPGNLAMIQSARLLQQSTPSVPTCKWKRITFSASSYGWENEKGRKDQYSFRFIPKEKKAGNHHIVPQVYSDSCNEVLEFLGIAAPAAPKVTKAKARKSSKKSS